MSIRLWSLIRPDEAFLHSPEAVLSGRWSWALIAGWIVLLLSCPSTAGCSDIVFATLFRTAVERVSCRVCKLIHTGGAPTTSASVVLAVADGLFGLCGSERLAQAIHRYPNPHSPSLKDRMWSLWTLSPTFHSVTGSQADPKGP